MGPKRTEVRPLQRGSAIRPVPKVIDHQQRRLHPRSEDGGETPHSLPAGQEPSTPRPVSPSPKDYMPFMTEAQQTEFLEAGDAVSKYHADRLMANEEIETHGSIQSDELRKAINRCKANMARWAALRYAAIKKLVASDQTKPEWTAYWDQKRAKSRDRSAQWLASLSDEVAEARKEYRRIKSREKTASRSQRIAFLEAKAAESGGQLEVQEQEELKELKGQLRAEADAKIRRYHEGRQQVMLDRAAADAERNALEPRIRSGRYSVQDFQRWEELIQYGSRGKMVREMKEFRVRELEKKDPGDARSPGTRRAGSVGSRGARGA